MRGNSSRTIAVVTAAALTITSFGIAPAFAAPAAKPAKGVQVAPAGEMTDFSSRSRHRRNRAAGAAILGAIIGGVATYAAAREYRKARERELQYRYGYYGHPRYYAPRHRYYRHW